MYASAARVKSGKAKPKSKALRKIARNWDLYIIIAPVVLFFCIFHYAPMYGLQLAFKNFLASRGIWGSPWIGFANFTRFFNSFYFVRLIRNTIGLSFYQLAIGFPAPILLALMMNEVRSRFFRKTVQMVTYAPHFLSMVVLVGMLFALFDVERGLVNNFLKLLGADPVSFMGSPQWFKTMYVFSEVWQNAGWKSIIYMAALAGIDPQLYEAASVDGASKLQKTINITIPGILPQAIILLILDVGHIMNIGFEKVYLMQNAVNMEASDVISTYVYKTGILGAQYSFTTAIGFFNSAINVVLVLLVNRIARKVSDTSLW
ncbi:MAG: ABC transporter permease subunit [Treponema sp.]|nr:ABC transporter permease subunit [Treponema sp.]